MSGVVNKQQARALLGYATENDGQFARVFYGEKPGTQTDGELSGAQLAEVKMLIQQWDESQHPRDKIGRFTRSEVAAEPMSAEDQAHQDQMDAIREAQAHREIRSVHDALGRALPHLKSRWKGKLIVDDFKKDKMAGGKNWFCNILLERTRLRWPAKRLCTMIHESLHAYAPTTKPQYDQAFGREESVIEHMVMIHRQRIAHLEGINITAKEFHERDRTHPYRAQVIAIDEIRRALGSEGRDKSAFYTELHSVPANQKSHVILAKAEKLSQQQRVVFDAIFEKNREILDEDLRILRATGLEPSGTLRSLKADFMFDANMTADELVKIIMRARGEEMVRAVRKFRNEWVDNHPNISEEDLDRICDVSEKIELQAEGYGFPDAWGGLHLNSDPTPPELSREEEDAELLQRCIDLRAQTLNSKTIDDKKRAQRLAEIDEVIAQIKHRQRGVYSYGPESQRSS